MTRVSLADTSRSTPRGSEAMRDEIPADAGRKPTEIMSSKSTAIALEFTLKPRHTARNLDHLRAGEDLRVRIVMPAATEISPSKLADLVAGRACWSTAHDNARLDVFYQETGELGETRWERVTNGGRVVGSLTVWRRTAILIGMRALARTAITCLEDPGRISELVGGATTTENGARILELEIDPSDAGAALDILAAAADAVAAKMRT